MCLNPYDNALRLFARELDTSKHMIDIELFYFQKNFFKQDGSFHKRAGDVDNPNKIIIDQLFERMGLDDYLLGKLSCEKLPSDKDSFMIRMTKYDASKYNQTMSETIGEYLEDLALKESAIS